MTEEARLAADTLRKMANFKQFLAFPQDTGRVINACADLIESLSAQLEQVTRERDAAINDLRIDKCCQFCVNDETKDKLPFACTSCGTKKSNWQWRGVEVE